MTGSEPTKTRLQYGSEVASLMRLAPSSAARSLPRSSCTDISCPAWLMVEGISALLRSWVASACFSSSAV